MPSFPFNKQVLIVVATMAIHNYIRRHCSRNDKDFQEYDENPDYVPEVERDDDRDNDDDGEDVSDDGVNEMIQLRDNIAASLRNR